MKPSQLMQQLLRVAGVGAAALAVAGLSGEALAGIASTKHNLTSSSNTNHITGSSAGTEICVFCHTPHGSETAIKAPIWNRASSGNTYTTYATMASSTLDSPEVLAAGSVSLACLSCHDGTQAMDSMMNAPGSGNTAIGGTWAGNVTNGKLNAGLMTNLGTDLSNDHPIGIAYCGGHNDAGTTCADKDFKAPTQIGTLKRWFVETGVNSWGGAAGKDKTDMILFTRDFNVGGTQTAQGSVECASCHDPHVESKNSTSQVAFLRVSQEGSGVCLACHTK
jgi:hypothetical protein